MQLNPLELQYKIKEVCQDVFEIIKKNEKYKKIRTIIIQYNSGNITIGFNCRGTYIPRYYNMKEPTCLYVTEPNPELNVYLEQRNQIIYDIFEKIREHYPNTKIRSYNIFFKKSKVNICFNKIGNKSMGSCRIYEEF